MRISGYVPFYNNATTVLAAVDSLRAQVPPLDEIFAVDDGSTDGGAARLEAAGVRVLRQPGNLGRGAARARAMKEARHELVLCCDATNALPPDFAQRAARWFEAPAVAAVFGRITQPPARNAVERWRGRHLFRMSVPMPVSHGATLITYGTLIRKSAEQAVGGFDVTLTHTEDAELGERMLRQGFDVVFDPSLLVISNAHNSLSKVLERHWRWSVGKEGRTTFRRYCSQLSYAAKVMAREDLKAGDWPAAGISLLSPHYAALRKLGIFR